MGCNLVCFNNSGLGELNSELNGDKFEIKQDKTKKHEKQNSQTTSISFDNVQRIEDYYSVVQVLISNFRIYEKRKELKTEPAVLAKTGKSKSRKSKKREKSRRKGKKLEVELEKIAEEPVNHENFAIADLPGQRSAENGKSLLKERTSSISGDRNDDIPDYEVYEQIGKNDQGSELEEDSSHKLEIFDGKLDEDQEIKDRSTGSLSGPASKNPKRQKIDKKDKKKNKENRTTFKSESSPHGSSSFNQSWDNLSNVSSVYRSLMQTGQIGIRKLLSSDGQEIVCNFASCPFSGEAKYVWPDKSVYEGSWVNNKMHGSGIMLWPDGRVYKGEFSNGAREGRGAMTWPNGNTYEGFWKSGKQDGAGVLSIKGRDKSVMIRGVWAQGMRKSTVYNT